MKQWIVAVLLFVLVLSGCSVKDKEKSSQDKAETKTYTMDSGDKVEIPKSPKRIAVVAATYAGGLKHLGAHIVAVNKQVDDNDVLRDKFKDVEKISDDDVEKVAQTKPDLILVFKEDKNIKKYQKIAPTIVIDYSKHKYLEQQKMLGEIIGEEKKAEQWIKDWKSQTAQDGRDIKGHIGASSTVTIFDEFDKKLYTYGDNWGRGSEVLYQAFGLKMPDSVKALTEKDGWAEIPKEKVEAYAGDYIVSTRAGKAVPEYAKTALWKNIPAVKNDKVIKVAASTYWFNDPYSLEYIRKDLKQQLLNK